MKRWDLYRAAAFITLIGGLAGPSCIYEYPHCEATPRNMIKIVVDWDKAPGASPEGVAVCFFPVDGGEIWRFDLPSCLGGNISLPDGQYRMMLFNNDTSDILFKDVDDYSEYDAYTLPVQVPANALDGLDTASGELMLDNSLMECPDMLWCACISDVTVTATGVSYEEISDGDEIVCHPDELCANYHCRISDIRNLRGVQHIFVALSGLSGSVTMASGDLGNEPVAFPVPVKRDGSSTLDGSFVAFGRCPRENVRNILSVIAWMSDGSRLCHEFDVTDQVAGAPDPHDVYVEVSGMEFPDVTPAHGDQSTLDVEVVDWLTTYIEFESNAEN